MTLTEEQIAGLTSDMARRIESHDLFDVPDGAKYHTAANIIATDLMRRVVGPALEAANKRADEAEALVERLKHEAQIHAQEARTANTTIAEIYREVSGGKGEPGNWHGAEPVRRELTALRARVAELERALKTIARHPIENFCMGRPDLGIPGYASCQDVARAALTSEGVKE